MPHPGFDWYERQVRETVSRLPAACLMEESARLLYAASLLWPGRVRAKELTQISLRLSDIGIGWRNDAVCLSDHPWTNGLEFMKSAGRLLGEFRFDGKSGRPKSLPGPNRIASRVLVRAAFDLVYRAIPMIRASGGSHRDKEADQTEDLLEIPEEAPYAACQEKISPEAMGFLASRSASVFNAGLSSSLQMIFAYQGGLLRKPRPPEQEAKVRGWEAAGLHWSNRAEADFHAFVDLLPLETAGLEALRRTVGRPYLYVPFGHDHYADDETTARTELVARALASALWNRLGHQEPIDLCSPAELLSETVT